LAGAVLLGPPVASAAVPQLLRQITSEGAGAAGPGGFEEITGLGTDPHTGHIYGLDAGNNRVDEFTPWGEFVKAFGWDVAPGAINEQQEIRVRATSGEFRLTFGADTTGDLASDAPATVSEEEPSGPESVEAALNSLPSVSVGGGSVSVEGHPGNPVTGATPFVYVIVFKGGPLAGSNVSQVTAAPGTTPLAGGSPSTELETATRADGTSGGTGLESCTAESGCKKGLSGSGAGQISGTFIAAAAWGLTVDDEGNVYLADRENHRVEKFDRAGRFVLAYGGDVVAQGPDNSSSDEKQEITVAATSGTFELKFQDPFGGATTATTAALPFNATAGQVESALNGLSTISSHGGSVTVTAGPGNATGSTPYVVTFAGGLSGDDVPQLTIDRSALGPAAIGARLVCSSDTEADSHEFAWRRNGEPISGANSQAYTTTAADEGKVIQCQVTAKNVAGGAVQVANPAYVAPPEPGVAVPVAPESIQPPSGPSLPVGGPAGQTLTCLHGAWQSATSFSYRWFRNGVEIPGATAETYVVTSGDLATAASFQCAAIGTNAGGSTTEVSKSLETRPPPRPPAPSNPLSNQGMTASMEPVLTVAQGGGPEVCRAAAGDVCKNGTTGKANGEFAPWPRSNFLTAGPDGTVYVGDRERLQRFEPDGTFKSQIPAQTKFPTALGAAPSGDLFADFGSGQLNNPPEPGVAKLDSSGAPLALFGVALPTSLAVDGSEDVFVIDRSQLITSEERDEVLEFDSSGSPLIPDGSKFAAGNSGESGEILLGLAANSVGDVVVSSAEKFARLPSYLGIYGPPPIELESPPRAAPEITAEYAMSVGTQQAAVQAKINPKFWTDTQYQVEYGTSSCSSGGCATVPASPELLTEASVSSEVRTAVLDLSSLTPGTVYHYRFVAQSGGGGPVQGSEATFRTYTAPSSSQADRRAYEMVSPGAKEGAEVGLPERGASGAAEFSVQPLQASPSGNAVTYSSFTAFGNAQSAPAASQYLSTRGPAGWETQNIDPRFEEGYTRDPLVGFSSDLSHGAVIVIEPPLSAGSYKSLPNLYLRDNAESTLIPITTEPPTPQVTGGVSSFCLMYEGSSADSNHVFFAAHSGALLNGDPTGAGFNLYEWTPNGGVQLVSLLPNGTPATPAALTTVGNPGQSAGGGGFARCLASFGLMRRGVSASGSRVFWHYEGSYEGAKEPLFARVGGSETVRLDVPNVGVTGIGGQGKYWDASTDGSRVYFTAPKRLTQQPTAAAEGTSPDENLYSYDFDLPEGERLTNLAPKTGEGPHVQGVIGASEGGDFVYFVATGALASGAQAGKPNLYAWHDGEELRYIATLAGADESDWSDETRKLTAQVTADGRHLAFLSTASLTGFNNRREGNGTPMSEVYLYDFDSGGISCASCNAGGTAPAGSAAVPSWSTPYQAPRYLSGDGRRLFFTTPDALSPSDRNGGGDVYEFERSGTGSCGPNDPAFNPDAAGCDYLISSGSSGAESYFIDASSDGSDVFFSTRDRLDPFRDQDERYDIYDARVDGTPPSPLPSGCKGSCPEGGSSAPAPVSPATSGSVPTEPLPKALHCRKGTRKVRRHGKTVCVKVRRNGKHATKGKSGR
jgi:hypothetical protein